MGQKVKKSGRYTPLNYLAGIFKQDEPDKIEQYRMKNTFDFLSGNVPGGIGLYVLLVVAVFLVLFGISRRNDLFTPRLFKIWFGIVGTIITLVYISVWVSNPPPSVLNRYSTIIFAEEEQDRWLAYYFRDELSEFLQPSRSFTNYFFPQRWNYLAGVDCAENPGGWCAEIARKLPLEEAISGEIKRKGGKFILLLSFMNFKNGEKKSPLEIEFSPESPGEAIPQMLSRLNDRFPVRKDGINISLPDRDLALAKDAFYRQEYRESLQLCGRALKRHPENKEILKWYYYNRIRLAKELRLKEKQANPGNPPKLQKSSWQSMAEEARAFLVQIFKKNYEEKIDDVLLNNMIAESFIIEEYYSDAEEFLKIAFFVNPFNLEVLENLSLLHNSRYEELPFDNETEVLERILNICPLNERILTRYVDKLLLNVAINEAPSEKIKERIDRVLDLNPNSAAALILQGKYYLMVFRYRDALRAFSQADSLEPGQAVVHYNLGVTYFKLKDFETAERFFQKAIRISDYLEAHLYLGVIYRDRGEYQKALEKFRYRVAHKKGDDDYYAVQAMKGIRECLEALNIPIPQ